MVDVNVSYIKKSLSVLERVHNDRSGRPKANVDWHEAYTDLNKFEKFWYIETGDYDDYIRNRFSATYKKINGSDTVSLDKDELDRILDSLGDLKDKSYDSTYIVDDFDVRDVINMIEEETGIIHKG